MNPTDDTIARVPVKCIECSIWWRGLTHRCEPSPASRVPMDSKWKEVKPDIKDKKKVRYYYGEQYAPKTNTVKDSSIWGNERS